MSILYQFQKDDLFACYTHDENPDPRNFSMHTHTFAELYYFISGKGVYHIEGNEYPLQSGDILLMRPGESHYIEIKGNTPYERVVLSFPVALFSDIDPENLLAKPLFERKAGQMNIYKSYEFNDAIHTFCINKIIACAKEDYLGILSNLLPLLNEIRGIFANRTVESSEDTFEYKLVRYINKNIQAPLSLDVLSKKFFMSKQQLCRIFKKTTGTTVWKYIMVKRLIYAHQLIAGGSKPTDVYAQVGFNDYSSFYRAYVKEFGISPGKSK